VLQIAEEAGSTAVEVSLAWLRRRAERSPTTLIPIVGPRSLSHLEGYLRSLDLELDDEQHRRLDDVSAVRLGTPHEDVVAALDGGIDGDRSALAPPYVPVV
jgi:aryl-alcohol dehydrogenase-like predicted oxidoreductase